jgi:hypothetical protein
MFPRDDDTTKMEYFQNESAYETDFARIAPFILARGRHLIGKLMKPYVDDIVRTHTDGIISKNKLDIKTGNKLGELEYDGFCEYVQIENNISVKGEFIK